MIVLNPILTDLCCALWNRYETPFKWESKFQTNKVYKVGCISKAVMQEGESFESLALRLVKNMSSLIEEIMPEQASKVYLTRRGDKGFSTNKSETRKIQRLHNLPMSALIYSKSLFEDGKFAGEITFVRLIVSCYFDKGTIGYIRKTTSPLARDYNYVARG